MGYDYSIGRPKVSGNHMQERSVVPTLGSHPAQPEEAAVFSHEPCVKDDRLRPSARVGDNGIDRPIGRPTEITPVDPDRKPEALPVQSDVKDILCPRTLSVPACIRSPVWILGMVLLLATILLYVLSHVLSVVHDALDLPGTIKWTALFGLSVLVGVIAYVIIKAIMFVLHLSHHFQLSINQLRGIGNCADDRTCSVAKEKYLEPYLRSLIARHTVDHDKFYDLEARKNIVKAARWLLDPDRITSSREWVKEFQCQIQSPLEIMAQVSIAHYAKLVAVKTAISPWPFVDIAAVLYNATQMIADVALIFNQRFSRLDTVRLLLDILFTVYVAGETQDAMNTIATELGGSHAGNAPSDGNVHDLSNSVLDTAFEGASPVVTSFAKEFLKKGAEGAANWLLMKRLGRRAVMMLKPIA